MLEGLWPCQQAAVLVKVMKVQTWYAKALGLSQDKKRRQEKERQKLQKELPTCSVGTDHGMDWAASGRYGLKRRASRDAVCPESQ